MIRLEGRIYKTEDKYVILILDDKSREKIKAKSSFFKIDTSRCKTEDEIILKYGFIGDVSVLAAPVRYKFDTDKGTIEGVRYVAKSMRRLSQY